MPDLITYYKEATGQQEAIIGLVVAGLLLIAGAAALRRLRPWTSYLRPKAILTANEKEFFYRLLRAAPNHHVFAQVSFSALIDLDPKLSRKDRFTIRRRYGWKIADFVICKPDTLYVLAIVELDDRTHVASADRKRDAIMSAAGYPTLRYQSKHKPSVKELAETLNKLGPTREKSFYG